MDKNEIRRLINTEPYGFLKSDPHLGDNICFMTLGGSHSYGLNTKDSDVDIRGCALNSAQEILLGNDFGQVTETETDTVIYSVNKFLTLLGDCNPNVISLLGNLPEQYWDITEEGRMILDNKDIFLSKRCINSFGGYANQQLRRLENALARDSYPAERREEHIMGTINNMVHFFEERYPGFSSEMLKLYIDESAQENLDSEIYIDLMVNHIPLRSFKGILSEMTCVINEYAKLNKRNTKKDKKHLCKHMSQLLLLYMIAIDLLTKKEIISYRADEHELLMNVRNGMFLDEAPLETIEQILKEVERLRGDFEKKEFSSQLEYTLKKSSLEKEIERRMMGIYQVSDSFNEIMSMYDLKFEEAKNKTTLPDLPDYEQINNIRYKINLNTIKKSA